MKNLYQSSQPLTSNQDATQPASSTNERKPLQVNPEQIAAFFEKLETEHGELPLPAELKTLKRWHKAYQRQQKEANQPSRTKSDGIGNQTENTNPSSKVVFKIFQRYPKLKN